MVGRWGEASPSKHPASPHPPKRKKELRKEEKERERVREREVHGGGRGVCIIFCVALQVISILSPTS